MLAQRCMLRETAIAVSLSTKVRWNCVVTGREEASRAFKAFQGVTIQQTGHQLVIFISLLF